MLRFPTAYPKTLISYFESSLYAHPKPYKYHNTMVMRCVPQELRPFELNEEGREAFESSFFPFLVTCKYRLLTDVLDPHCSDMTFDQHTMNFQNMGLEFQNEPLNF